MLKLAAIVGPTAVGKTEISLGVAQQLNGEIISCDSMQVYKGMDIGTAKASPAEQKVIPHHMIDIVEANAHFTVADYQRLAKNAIHSISRRGKLPILVGGTGLYYQALVDDFYFLPMESQKAIREKLEKELTEKGLPFLYEQLRQIDPTYAIKVGANDKKRIIRALEVYELTGRPFSEFQVRNCNTYHLAAIGLYMPRAKLYARIEERVEEMIATGLIEEVVLLRQKGYNLSLNSMQALGYKQAYRYLEGEIDWEEMKNDIKRETRRFAKRQYTWFRKDERINWVDVSQFEDRQLLVKKICQVIGGLIY